MELEVGKVYLCKYTNSGSSLFKQGEFGFKYLGDGNWTMGYAGNVMIHLNNPNHCIAWNGDGTIEPISLWETGMSAKGWSLTLDTSPSSKKNYRCINV